MMHQALTAIEHVHKHGFVHRDIKPENFLVKYLDPSDKQNVLIKLADFGLAREMRDRSTPLTEYVSTRWYRAPELLLKTSSYGQAIDIFALGCIMAELFLGRPLFPGRTESEQLMTIVTVIGTPSV